MPLPALSSERSREKTQYDQYVHQTAYTTHSRYSHSTSRAEATVSAVSSCLIKVLNGTLLRAWVIRSFRDSGIPSRLEDKLVRLKGALNKQSCSLEAGQ